MELRHLRYFVAVAEEQSFVGAARRLRLAQPALSRQIADLETELGVRLFHRLPRGVRVTAAGEAFLLEARRTLEGAAHAVASARNAARDGASYLEFAHGALSLYGATLERLLAAFRESGPDALVRVSSQTDADAWQALWERRIDVASVFIAKWPVEGFGAHRLLDCTTRGVLLPASHPLAAKPVLRLAELRDLTWLHTVDRWPGVLETIEAALRERGLVPKRLRERAKETPAANTQIAAGEAWSLVSEAIAEPYRTQSSGIVYRPFVEPDIPVWLALVWVPKASRLVCRLVDVASGIGLAVPDREPARQTA